MIRDGYCLIYDGSEIRSVPALISDEPVEMSGVRMWETGVHAPRVPSDALRGVAPAVDNTGRNLPVSERRLSLVMLDNECGTTTRANGSPPLTEATCVHRRSG